MTVSYSETISSSQGGVFIKILLLWRGSLYKLVYTDLFFYLVIYYAFNISYRCFMSPQTRQSFELVVKLCNEMDKSIPLSFILGFFVAGVIGRWWQMYLNIPWLNRISFLSYGILTGTRENFEQARRLRLSMMRYLNIGWILLMHSISEKVMHQFSDVKPPDETEEGNSAGEGLLTRIRYVMDRLAGTNQMAAQLRANSKSRSQKGIRYLLESINRCTRVRLHFPKLVTETEIQAFERAESEYVSKYWRPYVPDYWLPLQWAVLLCKKAMVHGFCDPRSMVKLMEEIEDVRGMMQTLVIYNEVMIPLVYTQVVIIAVYSYFLLQLFSQQFVNPKWTAEALGRLTNTSVLPISTGSEHHHGEVIDMYFPVFTVFQFLFLMGWLKVAMCVMNPFGDDDEDFHTLEMLDYNLEISSRCSEAPSSQFPEGLSEASMEWIRRSPGSEADSLFDYLASAESEFRQAGEPSQEERLHEILAKPALRHRLRAGCCLHCGSSGSGEASPDAAGGQLRMKRLIRNGKTPSSPALQPLTSGV
ncbi:hypothetical protein BOX15_Mlig007515g1 [Macrostomum lignano]|uniref:Bestrophin homolog n=1 Tax=Macrostomum lignano TaxID=282301 RepID=A0A267E0S0_9PLAT|nr:hypothetical protein BOX15_Mlig007515g1 [Macrostomum lignano]